MQTAPAQEIYGERLFSTRQDTERERLDLLAQTWDPATTAHLRTLPLAEARSILEIGPGVGSIADLLAESAPHAEVTALDRDTTLLRLRNPRVRPLQADITDAGLELGAFDLIHARCVLMHLRDHEAVLARLVSWLRPGGHLVLSDTAELGFPHSSNADYRATMQALSQVITTHLGSDQNHGLGHPARFRQHDLTDIRLTTALPTVTGDAPISLWWQLTLEQARPELIRTGLVDAPALDRALHHMAQPTTHELSIALLTCSGRKRQGQNQPTG
ncbi:class I SAM-dependent methyltransferase [Streptomyces cadmiisoli]|uniref:class I SAM-dependent methyltransferase n=1 Tax=Streptomyces cadmiisoli TaxID=2184053 RepID=UPI003D74ECC3